jgi:predicted nucleic acid-binding protein
LLRCEISARLTAASGHSRGSDRLQRFRPKSISRGTVWITDAHLAALAIEHGLILCSTDGDFARFPGLSWRNPLGA